MTRINILTAVLLVCALAAATTGLYLAATYAPGAPVWMFFTRAAGSTSAAMMGCLGAGLFAPILAMMAVTEAVRRPVTARRAGLALLIIAAGTPVVGLVMLFNRTVVIGRAAAQMGVTNFAVIAPSYVEAFFLLALAFAASTTAMAGASMVRTRRARDANPATA